MSEAPFDPILGTTVADTVSRIMGEALRVNTAEAWHDAAQQLWGIDRLIGSIRAGGEWGTYYAIAISNEIYRCQRFEDSPENREAWDQVRSRV